MKTISLSLLMNNNNWNWPNLSLYSLYLIGVKTLLDLAWRSMAKSMACEAFKEEVRKSGAHWKYCNWVELWERNYQAAFLAASSRCLYTCGGHCPQEVWAHEWWKKHLHLPGGWLCWVHSELLQIPHILLSCPSSNLWQKYSCPGQDLCM